MSHKVKKSVVFAALMACTGLTPAYANMLRTAGDASNDELNIPQMVPQSSATGGDNLGDHRATEPLVMGGYGITGVGLPQPDGAGGFDPSAAVNVQFLKGVVDGIKVPTIEPDNLGNHTATQILNMAGHAIVNVADSYGGAGHQAVNIRTLNQYLAALPGPDNLGNHIATRTLNLNGNTIQLGSITSYDGSGNPVYGPGIKISGTTITKLGSPVNATDAVNKAYVDAQIAAIPTGDVYTAGSGLILSGNTFAVDATVVRTTGTQTIAGAKTFSSAVTVATPTANGHATTKAYVDGLFSGIPAGQVYTAGAGLSLTGNVFAVNNTVIRTTGNQTMDGVKTFNQPIDGTVTVKDTRTLAGSAGSSSYIPTPDDLTSRAVTNLFSTGFTGSSWRSALMVKGWGNGNASWAISGPASTADDRWFLRSGLGTTWGADYEILHSGNVSSYITNTTYSAGSGLNLSGNTFSVNSSVVRTTGNQTIGGTKTFSSPIEVTNTFNVNGSGPGQQQDGFYVADLGTSAGSTKSPNYTLGIMAQTSAHRSIGLSVDTSGYLYGFRSYSSAGTYTWESKVREADVAGSLSNPYSAGSGLSLSGNTFSVNSTVVRTSGNQSIAGVKTFSGSIRIDGGSDSPDLVIRRTNSGVNANMRFYTTGSGDVTVGQGDNTWFNVGSGNDIRYSSTGVFAIRTTDGYIRWKGTANGDGSGITNLNASNLSTGTVPEARLPIRRAGNSGSGVLGYNGNTSAAGELYGGSTNPRGSTRLNYNGNFYATRMWATAYYYFSDERLKTDIETISPSAGTEIIKELRPVSYSWKQDGKQALGVIAQEVQQVIPTAVIENEGGDLAVDYVQMIAPMVAAMQDMEARITELEAELKEARAE